MPAVSRRFVLQAGAVALSLGWPVSGSRGQGLADFVCATDIPPLEPDVDEQSAEGEGTLDEGTPGPNEGDLSLQGSARRALRWREGDGFAGEAGVIWLGVGFVRDYPAGWRSEVIDRAMEWVPPGSALSRRIRFDFTVPIDRCHIRIAQSGVDGLAPANQSLLGRDALANLLPDGKSTMQIFDLSAVAHEFGHALCLTHEHAHEALPVTIDRKKAIEFFGRTQHWSQEKTVAALFAPSERCTGDPGWNATSVMGYAIPAGITVEGVGLASSTTINARDRRCANGIYGVS